MPYYAAETGGIMFNPVTKKAICPFIHTDCIKKNQVCTLVCDNDDLDPPITTICPRRFEQDDVVDREIRHIMEELIETKRYAWRRTEFALPLLQEADVHGGSPHLDYLYSGHTEGFELQLIGVEYQSCYCSSVMSKEDRHPDILSAMKRLWWQIEQKVRILQQFPRNKLVVVVDRHFASHFPLGESTVGLGDANVVWLIVDYSQQGAGLAARLYVAERRYSTLPVLRDELFDNKLDTAALMKKLFR